MIKLNLTVTWYQKKNVLIKIPGQKEERLIGSRLQMKLSSTLVGSPYVMVIDLKYQSS